MAARFYTERESSIDTSIADTITFAHGLGETPDDCGVSVLDARDDQVVVNEISRDATNVVWQVSGTRETVTFRAWARRNHSIIDRVVDVSTIAISGSPAPEGAYTRRRTRIYYDFYDFGTRAVTFTG